MIDATEFGKAMGSIVREAVSPLLKRIEELESRQLQRGEKGDPGEKGLDGLSVTLEDVAPVIADAVAKAVEALPAPERGDKGDPGEKGADGVSVSLEDVSPLVVEAVSKAVADLPPAERGEKGEDGRDGADGKDAEPVDMSEVVNQLLGSEELRSILDACAKDALAKHFQENPVKDGEKGEPGEKGEAGEKGEPGKDAEPISVAEVTAELLATDGLKSLVDLQVTESVVKHFEENPVLPGPRGEQGEKGEAGADGVGLAGAVINRSGELVVTKTNGEAITLGMVIGKDGEKGADGKDGADFTNVEIDYDGERSLIIRGIGGEIVKKLPIPMDRGYYREGAQFEKGDIVTTEGSAWIALKDTDTKPGHDQKDAWRMFARKGKDGEKGDKGVPYVPPAPIKLDGPNG